MRPNSGSSERALASGSEKMRTPTRSMPESDISRHSFASDATAICRIALCDASMRSSLTLGWPPGPDAPSFRIASLGSAPMSPPPPPPPPPPAAAAAAAAAGAPPTPRRRLERRKSLAVKVRFKGALTLLVLFVASAVEEARFNGTTSPTSNSCQDPSPVRYLLARPGAGHSRAMAHPRRPHTSSELQYHCESSAAKILLARAVCRHFQSSPASTTPTCASTQPAPRRKPPSCLDSEGSTLPQTHTHTHRSAVRPEKPTRAHKRIPVIARDSGQRAADAARSNAASHRSGHGSSKGSQHTSLRRFKLNKQHLSQHDAHNIPLVVILHCDLERHCRCYTVRRCRPSNHLSRERRVGARKWTRTPKRTTSLMCSSDTGVAAPAQLLTSVSVTPADPRSHVRFVTRYDKF
jgi:hypothetical protein